MVVSIQQFMQCMTWVKKSPYSCRGLVS